MKSPKLARDFRRHSPRRTENKRVLIVCEGQKTEPSYLNDLVRDFGIHGDVRITGECGSAPISVVEKAIDLFNQDPSYDFVYCVFDKDAHVSYLDALVRVRGTRLERRLQGKIVHSAQFSSISSVPCFEYWLLLHFQESDAPMRNFAELRRRLTAIPHFANYGKGDIGIYALVSENMPAAIKASKRMMDRAKQTGTDNPTTEMHLLVEALSVLKRQ